MDLLSIMHFPTVRGCRLMNIVRSVKIMDTPLVTVRFCRNTHQYPILCIVSFVDLPPMILIDAEPWMLLRIDWIDRPSV